MRFAIGIVAAVALITGLVGAIRWVAGDWHEVAVFIALWIGVLVAAITVGAVGLVAAWGFGW